MTNYKVYKVRSNEGIKILIFNTDKSGCSKKCVFINSCDHAGDSILSSKCYEMDYYSKSKESYYVSKVINSNISLYISKLSIKYGEIFSKRDRI